MGQVPAGTVATQSRHVKAAGSKGSLPSSIRKFPEASQRVGGHPERRPWQCCRHVPPPPILFIKTPCRPHFWVTHWINSSHLTWELVGKADPWASPQTSRMRCSRDGTGRLGFKKSSRLFWRLRATVLGYIA